MLNIKFQIKMHVVHILHGKTIFLKKKTAGVSLDEQEMHKVS